MCEWTCVGWMDGHMGVDGVWTELVEGMEPRRNWWVGGQTGGGTKANRWWDVWPVDGGGWQPQVVVTKMCVCMCKKSPYG